jgi:hypothetical protein
MSDAINEFRGGGDSFSATSDEHDLEPLPQQVALPRIGSVIDDVTSHEHGSATEQIGQGIRAALGIGALAMLPDMIEDLRRTRDLDAKLRFVQMALKEGGYGTKDNKLDHLPTFVFNFVGPTGGTVEVVQQAGDVEDAVIMKPRENLTQVRRDTLAALAGMNDDFMTGEAVPVAEPSVFDLIEGL